MYFHYQNLNDERPKKHLSHARFWLGGLKVCWAIPSRFFGVGIGLGINEEALSFSLQLWFFGIWIGYDNGKLERKIQSWTKRKDERFGNGREIGFNIHSNKLWVSLWNDPMEHRSKDPKWWHFTIDPLKILFGKVQYSRKIIESRAITVPMPEKAYAGVADLCLDTWKRPRWFRKELKRVDIKLSEGIPFPGKGTAAHNCGPDAIHGTCTMANSIPEAVGKLVGSALSNRVRYGSWGDWYWATRDQKETRESMKKLLNNPKKPMNDTNPNKEAFICPECNKAGVEVPSENRCMDCKMSKGKVGKKEVIRWWIEQYDVKEDKSFVVPPRVILVFDDETCQFFTSEKAVDYVEKIDEMFKMGLQGDLAGLRANFKNLADLQIK